MQPNSSTLRQTVLRWTLYGRIRICDANTGGIKRWVTTVAVSLFPLNICKTKKSHWVLTIINSQAKILYSCLVNILKNVKKVKLIIFFTVGATLISCLFLAVHSSPRVLTCYLLFIPITNRPVFVWVQNQFFLPHQLLLKYFSSKPHEAWLPRYALERGDKL